MRLSHKPERLNCLSDPGLQRAIMERRDTIRLVRNQTGDDRCFLDYYLIWDMVADSPKMPLFSAEAGMRQCTLFYENCRAKTEDTVPPGTFCELRRWDKNLHRMSRKELLEELLMIQRAIVRHRDIESIEGRPRTIDDDRELFRTVLPEHVPGDFRLPPREQFLVSQTADTGCPSFWQSHAACEKSNCSLHQWGPCTTKK